MAHDVFVSHSAKDKAVAAQVVAHLEDAGIRCWVAPRDVQPGRSFAGEITRAIQESKIMVLIFSTHSNNSEQVLREVQLAVSSHLHIIQFRIEDVLLNDDLKYFLSTPHWLDALTPPLENHLRRLETSIKTLLDGATLAKIFLGEIKTWDDAAIKKLNASVNLPSQAIVVVHRSDGSGTTYNFAYYLAEVSADCMNRSANPGQPQNPDQPQPQRPL